MESGFLNVHVRVCMCVCVWPPTKRDHCLQADMAPTTTIFGPVCPSQTQQKKKKLRSLRKLAQLTSGAWTPSDPCPPPKEVPGPGGQPETLRSPSEPPPPPHLGKCLPWRRERDRKKGHVVSSGPVEGLGAGTRPRLGEG